MPKEKKPDSDEVKDLEKLLAQNEKAVNRIRSMIRDLKAKIQRDEQRDGNQEHHGP
jgi:hypothetical protein